ncbi:MAG: SpoIVB peptidase [Ignavibacteriales bacterium]
MSEINKRPLIGIILSLIIVVLAASPPLKNLLLMPQSTQLVVGDAVFFSIPVPRIIQDKLGVYVHQVNPMSTSAYVSVNQEQSGYRLTALKPGRVDVTLKLMGRIPLRSMSIESLPTQTLVAGGQSVGILLQSKGIMVVGFAPVVGNDLSKLYPAREGGIEIGDLIMKVNNRIVNSERDLADIVDSGGRRGVLVKLQIKRKEHLQEYFIKPNYCTDTGRYRIGLFVRDGVAGVGTLTFWDPTTMKFAALGHIIIDSDTKQPVAIRKGRIVTASVQVIQPGKPGRPGEKIGVFDRNGDISGSIERNSYYGIFGSIYRPVSNSLYTKPLPVAYAHQVKKGNAQMLTVVNGNQVEKFDIQIEKIFPYRHNGKGLVIRVTDPRLISLSGGIVQGMSGSPIIQNGHLIGAVTHVFLNNPERGYGIFMDTMIEALNSMPDSHRQIAQ